MGDPMTDPVADPLAAPVAEPVADPVVDPLAQPRDPHAAPSSDREEGPDARAWSTPAAGGAGVEAMVRRRRRVCDLAIAAPIVGAFLLVSPMVRAFARPVEVFGAPLVVVYIFVVWAVLIAIAVALARLLRPSAPVAPSPPQAGPSLGDDDAPPRRAERAAS